MYLEHILNQLIYLPLIEQTMCSPNTRFQFVGFREILQSESGNFVLQHCYEFSDQELQKIIIDKVQAVIDITQKNENNIKLNSNLMYVIKKIQESGHRFEFQ